MSGRVVDGDGIRRDGRDALGRGIPVMDVKGSKGVRPGYLQECPVGIGWWSCPGSDAFES